MSTKNNPILLGNIYPSNGQAGNVYSVDHCSPCVPGFAAGGGGKELKVLVRYKINSDIVWLGNIYGNFSTGYAGTVFGVNGVSQTIKANSGGNSQPNIVVKDVSKSNNMCK